ncbi:hypothetical protein [Pseudomonas coronafaciens]|uniref:hypothetical protein n=1 Tax=Pseudomonas coronafaciens TaxID=53409 RepID=UPI000A9E09BA|nr:hypothetical protein [Pseudomonas coronafaciens]
MKNSIKTLFALTLIASIVSPAYAEYVVLIPAEVAKGGALPDNSISFVTPTDETVEPEVPETRATYVDLIKKTKYFSSTYWPLTDTRNTSSFNTVGGGFKYAMVNGYPSITYSFKAGTDASGNFLKGTEFATFIPPKNLSVEYAGGTAHCTNVDGGYYSPYVFNAGMESGGTYSTRYSCDVQIAPTMTTPAYMNLTFTD